METVAQKTKRIIADTLDVDRCILTYDTDLKKDLNADSLDILEVVALLEDEFHITISDENGDRVKKVGFLIEYIEKNKSLASHSN